jgi:hypothetical protein
MLGKEVFRTCNVLPFSCTHLALWRGKGKVKDPRYMQKQKGFENLFTGKRLK